jgi:hypothetical protein
VGSALFVNGELLRFHVQGPHYGLWSLFAFAPRPALDVPHIPNGHLLLARCACRLPGSASLDESTMRPFEKNVSQRTFFLGSGPRRMQRSCADLDASTTAVSNNSDTRRMRIPLKGGLGLVCYCKVQLYCADSPRKLCILGAAIFAQEYLRSPWRRRKTSSRPLRARSRATPSTCRASRSRTRKMGNKLRNFLHEALIPTGLRLVRGVHRLLIQDLLRLMRDVSEGFQKKWTVAGVLDVHPV